jgi:hypothetical protein
MSRRIQTSAIAAAVTVALLAGCGGGGSGSNTTSSTTSAAVKTSQSTSSAALSTTSSSATSSVPANAGSLGSGAAAVYCESALAAAKSLSAAEKSQFKGYCASLAHATPSQLKSAEKTLCLDIIKDTVPSSEQALAKTECAKL